MNKKEKNKVVATIENEGFDYAFVDYSDFQEIKDEDFHKLRNEFLAARSKLAEYVGWEEE